MRVYVRSGGNKQLLGKNRTIAVCWPAREKVKEWTSKERILSTDRRMRRRRRRRRDEDLSIWRAAVHMTQITNRPMCGSYRATCQAEPRLRTAGGKVEPRCRETQVSLSLVSKDIPVG